MSGLVLTEGVVTRFVVRLLSPRICGLWSAVAAVTGKEVGLLTRA